MDDVLDCSLCFERYNSDARRPKILPCGHTFCLSCLSVKDNKCATCRAVYKGTPESFPDNFTLLSASGNVMLPKKRKFWCLDCSSEASPDCEETHTICSLKKILAKQVDEVTQDIQQQLQEEDVILDKLLEIVLPLHRSFHHTLSATIQHELKSHSVTKIEIQELLKSIPAISDDPAEKEVSALKLELSRSKERLPVLMEKLKVLQSLHNSKITIQPSDIDETWNISLQAGEMSEEQKGLLYILYLLVGSEIYKHPAAVPNSASGDFNCPIPSSPTSTPNGKCVVVVKVRDEELHQVTITLEEAMKSETRAVLEKGLTGLVLFPKKGALSGCLRTDAFFKKNKVPIVTGSVGVVRSPLHPLYIFVENPDEEKLKSDIFVWGRIVEHLPILTTILKRSVNVNNLATITNVEWV